MISRVGPFHSFGGGDWHSLQPDNMRSKFIARKGEKIKNVAAARRRRRRRLSGDDVPDLCEVQDFGEFLLRGELPLTITAFQFVPVYETGEPVDIPPLRVHHAHLNVGDLGEIAHTYDVSSYTDISNTKTLTLDLENSRFGIWGPRGLLSGFQRKCSMF